jgi:hypothetical protein
MTKSVVLSGRAMGYRTVPPIVGAFSFCRFRGLGALRGFVSRSAFLSSFRVILGFVPSVVVVLDFTLFFFPFD